MAEMTKSGYVYRISNIASFGDDVFEIGLTRRLYPGDRVRELGDASVPFSFDTHAMIYSDEAAALENAVHREFADRRINTTKFRKEFFKVSLDGGGGCSQPASTHGLVLQEPRSPRVA